MPAVKGQAKPQTKPEERGAIVERICTLYETQHATIESCCEAVGINARTFYVWISEDSQFSERYKKAKAKQDTAYWEEVIKPLSKTALQKLLQGGTRTEKKSEQGENANGSFSKDTQAEVEFLPNPTAAIFALKGLYPEMFAERSKVEQSGKLTLGFDFEELTPDQAEKILETIRGK